MNDHLAIALRSYLERHKLSALELERRAALPNATLAGIMRGTHPRSKTMSAILNAVPISEAEALLLAYLRDDCPDEWEDKITLNVLVAHLSEPVPSYGSDTPATIEAALAAFTRAAQGDENLREWLITSARILNLLSKE